MLAGLIRDDERRALDGIPGLSDLPLRRPPLRAHARRRTQQTDIILTLTPHIIRVLDLNEADLRPFRVGRDSLAPIAELPLPRRTAAAGGAAEADDAGDPLGRGSCPISRTQRAGAARCRAARASAAAFSAAPLGATSIFATFAPRPCSRSTSRP